MTRAQHLAAKMHLAIDALEKTEVERPDGEMNVLDSAFTATDELALVFEQIPAFGASGNMSRAHKNKNVARRLYFAVEVTIVRGWYEVVGCMKLLYHKCGFRRP